MNLKYDKNQMTTLGMFFFFLMQTFSWLIRVRVRAHAHVF